MAPDSRQMAVGRDQRTDDRGQTAAGRDQRTDDSPETTLPATPLGTGGTSRQEEGN